MVGEPNVNVNVNVYIIYILEKCWSENHLVIQQRIYVLYKYDFVLY